MCIVSVFMLLNIFPFAELLQISGVVNIFDDSFAKVAKVTIIIVCFLLAAINYFNFVYKGKYKIIVKEFKNEPIGKHRSNTIFLWLYALMSIAVIIVLADIMRRIKGN